MEKKLETTILVKRVHIGALYGEWKRKWKLLFLKKCIYWCLRENGKQPGSYYSILRFQKGRMERKMETTIVYWGYIQGYNMGDVQDD